MNKDQFLDLICQFETLVMQADHWRRQIGNCGGQCDGYDGQEDEGLCPTCCDAFMKVQAEDEKLARNKEFNAVLVSLKKACDDDKSGEFARILTQIRGMKVMH